MVKIFHLRARAKVKLFHLQARAMVKSFHVMVKIFHLRAGCILGVELKESVCENPACARGRTRAHTREDFEKLTEAEAIAAGKKAGVSQEVTRQVFADMKENGGGYITRGGVFVKVTGANLQAAIRTMAKHAKPESQAVSKPKPKQPTAAEVENAQALCAERCARFCNGKCGAGVAVLPSLSEHPHPPEECKNFKRIKAGENGGEVAR